MRKDGEVYYLHIDEITRENRLDRIRAERAMVSWLQSRLEQLPHVELPRTLTLKPFEKSKWAPLRGPRVGKTSREAPLSPLTLPKTRDPYSSSDFSSGFIGTVRKVSDVLVA
jgi:hypothetical protein